MTETTIGQALYEEAQRRLLAKFPLQDWRLEGDISVNHEEIDDKTVDFHVEATGFRLNIIAKCGDTEIANVWLEIEDGEVKLHAYDQAHEEPVDLRITETNIEIGHRC